MSVIAGFLVVNLPETHNRQLPETLDDVQALRDGSKSPSGVKSLSESTSQLLTEAKDERIKLLSDYEIWV